MKHYELISIFKPDLSKSAFEDLTNKIKKIIKDLGGNIAGEEIWALKDFAYTIKKYKKGYYIFLQIDMKTNKLSSINNSLNLDENILRYLLVKVDNHEKLPTIILKNRENNEK